jgi:hypothetical protein
MSDIAQAGGKAVTERLLEAMNAHDPQGHLACFNDDYRSEQPAHPARTFSGRKQVRENWSKVYESIPDFRAELLRLAVVAEEEWGGMDLARNQGGRDASRGTRCDHHGHPQWQDRLGRPYVEEAEREGADITETVRRMTGREEV